MGFIVVTLPNNKEEALPMQCTGYKLNFLWPFEENSPKWQLVVQKIGVSLTALAFLATLYAEWTFVTTIASDIPSIVDGLSTASEGIHLLIRILLIAARQAKMRSIYRRFYREVYFSKDDNRKYLKAIDHSMRVPNFFTRFYYTVMICLVGLFILEAAQFDLHANDKPYIFRMTFKWYDPQKPLAYIITSVYTTWTTVCVIGVMSAEDFTLCMMLCHTTFRLKQMQEDLENMYKDSLAAMPVGKGRTEEVHNVFRKKLNAILKRQQQLISFIMEANKYFTYTIFFSLLFGTLCICVVMFQFQRTDVGPDWVKYIVWIISQTSHVIVIGYFGQKLTDSATELQNSFYMCGWEKILEFGTTRTNKILMGDIRFAIMNAQKDVVLTGIKFIPLTHGTVNTALRSAMSYFMFLNTMDELANTKQ